MLLIQREPREAAIADDRTKTKYRPIPEGTLRALFDHSRWLTSSGRAGAKLVESNLDLTNCQLDAVDLRSAQIPNARFTGSTLRYARFVGADLTDAAIMHCDVEGADFGEAQLGGVLFLDTSCENALFEGADTVGAVWTEDDLMPDPQP